MFFSAGYAGALLDAGYQVVCFDHREHGRSGKPYRRELDGGEAGADDVLDAAIAAWTAEPKQHGNAQTLPEELPVVGGRAAAIWY